MAEKKQTVVLGVTASVAAHRACDLILGLKEDGFRVIPVLSRDAHHFVTPLSLQSLAAEEVYQDLFSLPGRLKPIHIELARAADVIAIVPASADMLARISLGLADDLVSSIVLAADVPIVAAPAMNDKMYENPATREHLERLRKRGVSIVEPVRGRLVCSDEAMGHLADLSVIRKEIIRSAGKKR